METFEQAARHIFSCWTALQLAVDQGWGGRHSVQKKNQLLEHVFELFRQPKQASRSPNNEVDVNWLADILADFISQEFCMGLEDDSDLEVSRLLLDLLERCRQGDLKMAQDIIRHRPADLSKCCAREEIEELMMSDDEMMVEMMGDVSMSTIPEDPQENITPVKPKREKVEKVID